MLSIIEILWLSLGLLHFGAPLIYYWWLRKASNSNSSSNSGSGDEGESPEVTVIVPTYNEEALIEKRLDNIYEQDYPKDKVRILLVDSASSDQTVELAKRWAERHKDIKIEIFQEPVRRGKPQALNSVLPEVDTDILVVTDADCLWFKDALKNAIRCLMEPTIGVVSGIKTPLQPKGESSVKNIEEEYRSFYNKVRVYESKLYTTPIIAGELFCVKKDVLIDIGGFDLVNDDSYTAMKIVSRGYRAIVSPRVRIIELAPMTMKSYYKWKITRAQHLLHNFLNLLKEIRKYPSKAQKIIIAEAYLHLINPWIFIIATALFIRSSLKLSVTAIPILMLASALLLYPRTRILAVTWITEQIILVFAAIKNLFTKSVIWEKIEEIRTSS
jgi:cellulose synthase/poly-beta-1,6-N-acetylglucosamine synthase-like glycosyltransferase